MSSHSIEVAGDEEVHKVGDIEPTTWDRFRDARYHIQQRNDREITNDEVLGLLLDAWWHHERRHAEGSS